MLSPISLTNAPLSGEFGGFLPNVVPCLHASSAGRGKFHLDVFHHFLERHSWSESVVLKEKQTEIK